MLIRGFSYLQSLSCVRQWLGPIGAASACFVVYFVTLAPTVTSEDSGELIAAAHYFGVPHPPGYPLWTMLCGIFCKAFPLGSVAWRANLFSALCSSLAAGVLCRSLQLLELRACCAFGASVAIGFGAVLWSQSVITEVYALHALMFSLVLWATLRWKASGQTKWLVCASGLFGLGMCIHHTLGLSAVGLFAWVIIVKPSLIRDWKLGLVSVLVFGAGLTPYSYLIWSARRDPPINWGEPKTMRELVEHANRKQYKATPSPNRPSPRREWGENWRQVRVIAEYCWKEHTPYLASLALLGLLFLAVWRGQIAILFGLVTVANVGLFLALHGIGPARQDIWSSKVFFVTQYMIMSIPLAYCAQRLIEAATWCMVRLQRSIALQGVSRTLGAVAASLGLFPLLSNWRENNYRHYWFAYDHAVNMLHSTLPNALILPSGDHNTFPLLYVTLVEGLRPDVVIADKYGYIEPLLYANMPGYEGRKPRTLEERNEIEEWLIRNAKRPVYYTVKKNSLVSNAQAIPVGVLYHLLPEGKALEQETPWQHISYRNLENSFTGARDYGADNILADYEFFRAIDSLRKNETETALAHFRKAAQYGREIKEVYNNIGCALAEHGLVHEAIEYYQLASGMDPKYASARWNLARVFKSLEDWPQAEAAFLDLAIVTPGDFRVFGELGFIAKILGHPLEVMVARFEESLRMNPSQPQIILELAAYHTQPQESHSMPEETDSNLSEAPIDPSANASLERTDPSVSLPTEVGMTDSEPGLSIDVTSWNFGLVEPGSEVSRVFEVRNRGPRAVRITDFTLSCTCVSATLDRDSLDPGEVAAITLELRAGHRPGELRHFVRVSTDSHLRPNFELQVAATVLADIIVDPPSLKLTGPRPPEPSNHVVTVRHRSEKPFSLLSIENKMDGVSVHADLHKAAKHHELRFLLDPSKLRDGFQGLVVAKTDIPWETEVAVEISVQWESGPFSQQTIFAKQGMLP